MIAIIRDLMTKMSCVPYAIKLVIFFTVLIFHPSNSFLKENKYKGISYDTPTQGVAQIVENPDDPQSLMIMYAGLSGDATQKICNKREWLAELNGWLLIDLNASYIIYDKYKRLVSGDWEDFDSDLVWKFKRTKKLILLSFLLD